jgi:hypothetical protein
MQIEHKIILTCLVLWLVVSLCANPTTKFHKWGVKKFGTDTSFYIRIAMVFLIPLLAASIYCIWK